MPKSKILCLHGFGTNAAFMKKQAASMVKLFEKEVQFIFVDGPFQAPQSFVLDQKVIDMIEGHHLTWRTKFEYTDFKEDYLKELDKLRVAFEKASDHYDGILGFSQGAICVHFLFRLQQSGVIKWKILEGIKFSIIMSANHFNYPFFSNREKQLDTPSLHIVSPEDFIYPKSILNITQFKDPLVISHSYGHKFPKLGLSEAKMLKSFIRKHSGTQNNKKQEFEVLNMSTL